MRVRIRATPREREIDGIKLEGFTPGSLHDVSTAVGSWLMAEGYAELEMRETTTGCEERNRFGATKIRSHAADRRHEKGSS
jgi:hypothetical protein